MHLGGHWALVFPRPVYWFMNRPQNGAFVSTHPRNTARCTAWRMRRRCSTSSGARAATCTRRIRGRRDRPGFRTGFSRPTTSAMPATWAPAGRRCRRISSSPRLGDRAFDLLDDLNNQGLRKRLLGEVDVFQFDHTHELYAHMNINYIKLDRLPAFDRWGDALAPLANGRVLHHDWRSAPAARWTLPHRQPPRSWQRRTCCGRSRCGSPRSSGATARPPQRDVIELADTREFGSATFEWRAKASGWKWARVAVWDVAGNGAFVNPFWRQ